MAWPVSQSSDKASAQLSDRNVRSTRPRSAKEALPPSNPLAFSPLDPLFSRNQNVLGIEIPKYIGNVKSLSAYRRWVGSEGLTIP